MQQQAYTNIVHAPLLYSVHLVLAENGTEATVDMLREWVVDMDKYLRERNWGGNAKDKKPCGMAALEYLESSVRKQ